MAFVRGHARESGWGTLVKLYEYSTAGFSGSNIVLTKGFVSDPALFKWRDEIAASGTNKIARRNGSIVALGPDLKEIARWNFQKAWPVRWEMSEFDASTGQALCEMLEIAVERITKA